MEKLTFYALSAPEKLDRIGAYLSERLSRDVARHRYGSAATFPTVSALKKIKKKKEYCWHILCIIYLLAHMKAIGKMVREIGLDVTAHQRDAGLNTCLKGCTSHLSNMQLFSCHCTHTGVIKGFLYNLY